MLNDRVVMVTGSTHGLGRSLVEHLLELGAKTTVTGRKEETVVAAVAELTSRFGSDRILGHAGDLTTQPTIASLVRRTLDAFGRIDGVVANLGSGRGQSGWTVGEREWNRVMELNFHAARRLLESTLSHMAATKDGSVVLISSIASLEILQAPVTYTVAKAALNAYAKALSFECSAMGIRINVVSPGNILVKGGVWDERRRQDLNGVSRMLEKDVPMKRFAAAAEIAEVVAFLLSGKSSFVNGAQIVVDGGQIRRIS